MDARICAEVRGVAGAVDAGSVRKKYRALTLSLIEKKTTITVMESCTGGQISSLLTDTEGSSEVFKGSCVTYSNDAKVLDGVPAQIIGTYGVYSPQTALALAQACRRKFGTDIGVGITGSFGNTDPANADSVPGEVYFAVETAGGKQCLHCTVPPQEDRLSYKMYMADVVADRLMKVLQG